MKNLKIGCGTSHVHDCRGKTESLLGEKKSLDSYPGKIENKGLAAVVTGEGPGLKRPTVVAADECTI